MNVTAMKPTSSSNSPDSEKTRLVRDKFALLARVGRLKRAALTLHEEADFYSTSATDLAAQLADVLEFLQIMEEHAPKHLTPFVAESTSRFHNSIRQLLRFSPPSSESTERYWKVLGSAGLEKVLATTPDGYVSLSTDLILKNVERSIAATKESNQRP